MDTNALEPAHTVIKKLGGSQADIARILDINRSSVSRWTKPKDRGGRGGLVPAEYQQPLLDYARRNGLPLTEADFFVHRVPRQNNSVPQLVA